MVEEAATRHREKSLSSIYPGITALEGSEAFTSEREDGLLSPEEMRLIKVACPLLAEEIESAIKDTETFIAAYPDKHAFPSAKDFSAGLRRYDALRSNTDRIEDFSKYTLELGHLKPVAIRIRKLANMLKSKTSYFGKAVADLPDDIYQQVLDEHEADGLHGWLINMRNTGHLIPPPEQEELLDKVKEAESRFKDGIKKIKFIYPDGRPMPNIYQLAESTDSLQREEAAEAKARAFKAVALEQAQNLSAFMKANHEKARASMENARKHGVEFTEAEKRNPVLALTARRRGISLENLEAMDAALESGLLPQARRYWLEKGAFLYGDKKLFSSAHIYAPWKNVLLPSYSLTDAKKLVIDEATRLSPKLGKTVREFLASTYRYDTNVSNSAGAPGITYSHNPRTGPYMYSGFDNTAPKAFILAHETGHAAALTSTAATTQAHLGYCPSHIIAEIPSELLESAVRKAFLTSLARAGHRKATAESILSFEGDALEIKMFKYTYSLAQFRFERAMYQEIADGKTPDAEHIAGLWEKEVQKIFGEKVKLEENIRYGWTAVPHLCSGEGFYNYPYIVSGLIAESLLSTRNEPDFAKRIDALYASGNRLTFDELCQVIKVNTKDPIFLKKGIEGEAALIDAFLDTVPSRTAGKPVRPDRPGASPSL